MSSTVIVGIISRIRSGGAIEYLLVSARRDFGMFTGAYYPPGGHIEENESKEQALAREIFEELQIQVQPEKEIAMTPGDIEGQITYWWSCIYLDGEIVIDREELIDAQFFSRSEIDQLRLWPATKKFFDIYILE